MTVGPLQLVQKSWRQSFLLSSKIRCPPFPPEQALLPCHHQGIPSQPPPDTAAILIFQSLSELFKPSLISIIFSCTSEVLGMRKDLDAADPEAPRNCICICMCMCVYIYIYIYTDACIGGCTLSTYKRIIIHMHVHVRTCLHVCMHVCLLRLYMCPCMWVCEHVPESMHVRN